MWTGDLNASPPTDADLIDSPISSDKKSGDRKKRIIDSAISIGRTHGHIKSALLDQGTIHWDERAHVTPEMSAEEYSKSAFRHIEYSIEDYSGEGCNVVFSRQLAIHEVGTSLVDDSVEMRDAEPSMRTVRFDASKVKGIVTNDWGRVNRFIHPEATTDKEKSPVREIIVAGDIEVDSKRVKEVALYLSLGEFRDGVSFADELETWLFHMVKMCRNPNAKDVV